MLRPKVSPQIHHLPSPQSNQHPHRPKRKPLHPLIRALIRIPQLLLARSQILHLANDLTDQLFDATQLGLDGPEFLLRLDGGPVTGVGADVDVELDGAGGVGDCVFGGLALFVLRDEGR